MRLHRFYVGNITQEHEFWLRDERLLNQWIKVLRFKPTQQVVLFDDQKHERMYEIVKLESNGAQLKHVTDYEPKVPARNVYLFWAVIKNDKNEFILQKCTEVGVSHFVPIIAERSEKKDINLERAEKIVIEAAEQCGRSDIPTLREPITLKAAINEFKDKLQLFVADKNDTDFTPSQTRDCGVFIGPEGGWSDREKELFKTQNIEQLNLGEFVLRAETAAIIASSKLL